MWSRESFLIADRFTRSPCTCLCRYPPTSTLTGHTDMHRVSHDGAGPGGVVACLLNRDYRGKNISLLQSLNKTEEDGNREWEESVDTGKCEKLWVHL